LSMAAGSARPAMTKPKLKLESDAVAENPKPASGEIVAMYNLSLKEALTLVRALVSGARIDRRKPEAK